jgi:hypothetical protein
MLVVHLDGVPRQLLETMMREGRMPFLARLLASGAYGMDTAFWGSPASTPCFQAGLLYGVRHPDLPAYNWFDRELGRPVKMNAPKDALAIEQRLGAKEGQSLLSGGGTAYLSLFRADAENRLCMSALSDLKLLARQVKSDLHGLRGPKRQGVGRYVRSLVKDTWSGGMDAFKWGRKLGWDFRHEQTLMMSRFFVINLGWNLSHSRALIDMVRGVPAIYLVFGNYDEVAHRRGPFSPQATAELAKVDASLAELYALSQSLDTPYDLYFVTDHGHVNSLPFERRGTNPRLAPALLEGHAPPLSGDIERGLLDGRDLASHPQSERGPEVPEVVEAGNFAHVYLTRGREPLEALDFLRGPFRDVLARTVAHPDIGITVVRRGEGAVALIGGGVYRADQIDSAPLASEFSKRAVADYLRELPHLRTAGDLVLYGQATAAASTVGFAWEFGSHGGLTRTETDSVVMWPLGGPVDCSGLGHVTQLHEKLSEAYRH